MNRVKHLLIATLSPAIVVSLLAITLLPTPPGGLIASLSLFLFIFCNALLGPAAYPLLYNQPLIMNTLTLINVVASLTSVVFLGIWLLKPKTTVLLYLSTTIWILIGGFATFIVISSGI